MLNMVGQELLILLSLMHRPIWMKSETPISKLVLQKFVAGRQETCSETCAAAKLTCNFEGINFVPLEELKATIFDLLPNTSCSGDDNSSSTLTIDINYQNYDRKNVLFSYNHNDQCTSGYIFKPGGPIPVCTVLPDSYQLLFCKCRSKIKRDYKFVAQQIRSKSMENCSHICSRQGLDCNFDGIDRIPLEELKAQIDDIFPGSFCNDANKSRFPLASDTFTNGSYFSYNIEEQCTSHYIFDPEGPVPQCAALLKSDVQLLICKCQIGAEETINSGGISTVAPEVTCKSDGLTTAVLVVVGVACGVTLIAGGMILFGVVRRRRQRPAASAGAENINPKLQPKKTENLKSCKKRKIDLKLMSNTKKKIIDTNDSKQHSCVSYPTTMASQKTKPSSIERQSSQSRNMPKSKTKKCTKSKNQTLTSCETSKFPDDVYETVVDLNKKT